MERLLQNNENELLRVIWDEKRDKNVGVKNPEALFIKLSDPNINLHDLGEQIFLGICSLPINVAYNWAKNWGRTWITLGFDDMSCSFLNTESKEAKIQTVLHTIKMVTPQERLAHAPEGKKYFIILNNEPSTIEGITLQIERMIDELIWCNGLKNRNSCNPIEAYKKAIDEVQSTGFDIYVMSKDDILALRQKDSRYAVRIYGNILKKHSVPEIIGAVGPFEECIRPKSLDPKYERLSYKVLTKVEDKRTFRDSIVLDMGICILKRPHAGHMLLCGILETARRSLDGNTSIVIHGNDTGNRVDKTIAHISESLNIDPAQVIELISTNKMTSEELEAHYRNRNQTKTETVVQSNKILKVNKIYFQQQAFEHLVVFQSFFGRKLRLISESSVPEDFKPAEGLSDNPWIEYGVNYTIINQIPHLLKLNGELTASATRVATMSYVSTLLDANTHIYIDGDRSIAEASRIMESQNNLKCYQYPGAAIGFNFKIASGSEGNSILFEQIINTYMETNPAGTLLEAVVFFVNSRYQLFSENKPSFFDYANPQAFIVDLLFASEQRSVFASHANEVIAKIESLVGKKETEVQYLVDRPKKRIRLKYELERTFKLQEQKSINLRNIFLQPDILLENPKVQSAIAKNMTSKQISSSKARIIILTQIATQQINLNSPFVSELKRHGYEGEKLINAIHNLVDGNIQMIRVNSSLHQQLQTIENLVRNISSINLTIADKLIQNYKNLVEKLFNLSL